jgi:hypothetical protein
MEDDTVYSDHDHDDDHDHEDDHDDDHDGLHLEIHRAVDELGKYAIDIYVASPAGIKKDTVIAFIDELMRNVTKSCMDNGADLVGHVKSIFFNDDGNIMSSIVDHRAPTSVKDSLDADMVFEAKFMLHVIVHGIWDDRVRESVLDVLDDAFRKWNIPYEVTADHFDTEKSIAHHSG